MPILALALGLLMACRPAAPTTLVVTATPEPPNLEATVAAMATTMAGQVSQVSAEGSGQTTEPPTTEPPTTEPPTTEPPTTEPPTAVPPTAVPPTAVPPTAVPPTAVPPTAAIPFGIVSAPVSVNVRSGPDTAYPTLRVSARGSRLEVIGRSIDGEWWQVRVPDLPGGAGWISTIYLETQNTGNVPVVQAPALPTATPTNTPRPPTPAPAQPPPNSSSQSLNLSAAPYYGSHTIFPTFDTQTVDIPATGGGEINVDNLSGMPTNCTGFVSSAPDVEIVLDGQVTSDLYIYFLSASDATLIINDAFGNWYCDDDSYGNGNPMVSFQNAANGTYDIWIGRYGSAGLTSPGTLIIGEFHP